jgi:hypothetical protein
LKFKATEKEKRKGGKDDIPMDNKKVQQRILYKENHPLE